MHKLKYQINVASSNSPQIALRAKSARSLQYGPGICLVNARLV